MACGCGTVRCSGVKRALEPVVAPEQRVCGDEAWCAENSEPYRLFGLGAEGGFGFGGDRISDNRFWILPDIRQ